MQREAGTHIHHFVKQMGMRVAVRVIVQCVDDTNLTAVAEKLIAYDSRHIYLLGDAGNGCFLKDAPQERLLIR